MLFFTNRDVDEEKKQEQKGEEEKAFRIKSQTELGTE